MVSKGAERGEEEKLTYPKAISVIICTEFCEKFAYVGMRTILALYIKNKLNFDDDTATVIFHTFAVLTFALPLFGAIVADSILGKFKTILFCEFFYCLGQFLLSASAVPTLGLPMREFSMIGLLLIALGTAGIKPCLSAFGGDQFVLPQQQKHVATYFSLFCFAISTGSSLSAFLTPHLRTAIKCFGDQDCYSVAFFIPTMVMVLALVIFAAGKPLYRIDNPTGNVAVSVIKCISRAIYNKAKSNGNIKREHWLDYAADKDNLKLINEIKDVLSVLKIFIPLPLFFALVDQQGSRWTFQATRMAGEVGSYIVKPDQLGVVPMILFIILIPLFDRCVYPLFAKIGCLDTQLKKMVTGGVLAAVAFIISAFVELRLETTQPFLPTSGLAQLRIFNPRDCHLPIVIRNQSLVMEPFGIWGSGSIAVTAVEEQVTSYVLTPSTSYSFKETISKASSGNPAIRVLSYNSLKSNVTTRVELSGVNYVFETNQMTSESPQITSLKEFNPETYRVSVNGKFMDSIVLRSGGVYTLQTYVTPNNTRIALTTVTPPNSLHILWLLPQYIIMTIAELLFEITGLEFAFTQAPTTLKSFVQAAWLLTIAGGNLIIIIITKADMFDGQASEFFFFAGLMAVDMVIFGIMAKCYKYKNYDDNTQTVECDKSKVEVEAIVDSSKRTQTDTGDGIHLATLSREIDH